MLRSRERPPAGSATPPEALGLDAQRLANCGCRPRCCILLRGRRPRRHRESVASSVSWCSPIREVYAVDINSTSPFDLPRGEAAGRLQYHGCRWRPSTPTSRGVRTVTRAPGRVGRLRPRLHLARRTRSCKPDRHNTCAVGNRCPSRSGRAREVAALKEVADRSGSSPDRS